MICQKQGFRILKWQSQNRNWIQIQKWTKNRKIQKNESKSNDPKPKPDEHQELNWIQRPKMDQNPRNMRIKIIFEQNRHLAPVR